MKDKNERDWKCPRFNKFVIDFVSNNYEGYTDKLTKRTQVTKVTEDLVIRASWVWEQLQRQGVVRDAYPVKPEVYDPFIPLRDQSLEALQGHVDWLRGEGMIPTDRILAEISHKEYKVEEKK